MLNYYRLLEVQPMATQAEIKRSYRRLVRKYHPDLNQEALDLHIKRLNEAYAVLSDPVKRPAYDNQRLEAARLAAAQEAHLAAQKQEAQRRQQGQASRERKMTWVEGVFGFVKELRKELRKDS